MPCTPISHAPGRFLSTRSTSPDEARLLRALLDARRAPEVDKVPEPAWEEVQVQQGRYVTCIPCDRFERSTMPPLEPLEETPEANEDPLPALIEVDHCHAVAQDMCAEPVAKHGRLGRVPGWS